MAGRVWQTMMGCGRASCFQGLVREEKCSACTAYW